MTEIEVKPEIIPEELPKSTHIRIVYATSKVESQEDPIFIKVCQFASKVLAMQYFQMDDGFTGTAFFCVLPKDWVAPTAEQSAENLKKLDEESPN